jgi:hypothetical protein
VAGIGDGVGAGELLEGGGQGVSKQDWKLKQDRL